MPMLDGKQTVQKKDPMGQERSLRIFHGNDAVKLLVVLPILGKKIFLGLSIALGKNMFLLV